MVVHFSMGQSVHYIWACGLARGRGMCLFVFDAPPGFLELKWSKQAACLLMAMDQCLHAPHGLTSIKQSQPT